MFKLSRKIKYAVAATLSVCMLTAATLAFSGTGTVSVGTYLNVRSSASTTSTVIGKLNNGTKVTIVDSTTGWYKINYNGKTGWVSSGYVTVSSNSTRIQTVVNTAKSTLGVKYVYGGASSATGFDCSGLTMYAYGKAGVTLPHSAASQSKMGIAVSRSNLQPGDLIFFGTSTKGVVNHIGIYIGGGNFINAQSGAGYVKEANLSNTYWSGVYITARRYIY